MSKVSSFVDSKIVKPLADRMVQPVAIKMVDMMKSQNDVAQPERNVPSGFGVPFGYNSQTLGTQKKQFSGISIDTRVLRQISVSHETVRAAINVRKRQINQLEWSVVDLKPKSGQKYSEEQIDQINDQIKNIGGPGVSFNEIVDKLIEDILVLDAGCFYKQKTRGGDLVRIIPVDGATIKRRVDESGMIPMPPEPAYEQWINGRHVADMTVEELVYRMMNPRSNSPYGLSPLESLIVTVDASFNAMMYNTHYLSDSNVPQGFLTMPEHWTIDQIREYKDFFDAMVSSPRAQAKVYPIPNGTQYQPTSKPKDFSFKEFFEYLDRKVMMLFDVTPQELGWALDQYKSNADGQEKVQIRKGIKPMSLFIESIFTDILQKDLGFTELGFKYNGLETKFDTEDVKALLPLGVFSIDEVRADRGLSRIGVGNAVISQTGITPIGKQEGDNKTEIVEPEQGTDQAQNIPSPAEDVTPQKPEPEAKLEDSADLVKAELKAWETKAINDIKKKNRVYRDFEAKYIGMALCEALKSSLEKATTKEEVKAAFLDLSQPLEKGVAKKDFISHLLTQKTSKKFVQSVHSALLKQISPFTNESTIGDISKMEKAVNLDELDGYFDSIEIQGLAEYLKWAAGQGGQHAYDSIGVTGAFKLTDERFADIIGDRESYLIDSVDETTKKWLVAEIQAGKEAKLTNREVADQIKIAFDEISIARADTIVNTEVANASMKAELATYYEQDIKMKMWITSEDDMVDSDCAELDGQQVPIEDVFSSGDDAPPLHPNCRCYIQAVLE